MSRLKKIIDTDLNKYPEIMADNFFYQKKAKKLLGITPSSYSFDTKSIYALSKIGANRVAIVDSFSPFIIYFYSILMLNNQTLSYMQFLGFIIAIFAILILTYEQDYDDINFKVKRNGILLVLFAMSCTGFGVVLLKSVLKNW